MKIKVEKFTLQRNGAKYPAGSVVDLPDKEADALVKSAPKEFSLLVEPTVQESVEAAEPALEDMDINALRALAAQMGIQVSKNFKRRTTSTLFVALMGLKKNLPSYQMLIYPVL